MDAATTAWHATAATYRSTLHSKIPSTWLLPPSQIPSRSTDRDVTGSYLHKYLTPLEILITTTPTTDLVSQLAAGQLTAVDVASAFCHRSALAHQFVNCLLEIRYAEAMSEAAELDRFFREGGGRVKGALHGLPVSLKDQFVVEGLEGTMGYVGWVGRNIGKKGEREESELVKILRNAGAVIFCKTSVPQSLMTGETHNNLINTTFNPHNRLTSPGGSSGGEAALLAINGSPLGVGSDIGGSVRIPSSYCGIYALKPSPGRFPYKGMLNSMDGQTAMPSVLGPMSTSLAALSLFSETVLEQKPWDADPAVINMPWKKEVTRSIEQLASSKDLCFAVYRSNKFVNPWPTVRRGLEEIVDALKTAGFRVIEWDPSDHRTAHKLTHQIYSADGGADIHKDLQLSGEPPIPQIHDWIGDAPGKQIPMTEWCQLNIEKKKFQEEYAEYWNSTKAQTGTGRPVDVVLMPATPTAAVRPEGYREHGYTTVVNLLGYTSVVMPAAKVDRNVDLFEEGYQPITKSDAKIWKSYDPELYHGMPVGVQIMGRRLEEEKVLAIAGVVEHALKKKLDRS
ncbi:hypothetical protein RUND412_007621 [Rhizina undulata]